MGRTAPSGHQPGPEAARQRPPDAGEGRRAEARPGTRRAPPDRDREEESSPRGDGKAARPEQTPRRRRPPAEEAPDEEGLDDVEVVDERPRGRGPLGKGKTTKGSLALRVSALVLGVLGSLCSAGLGFLWMEQATSPEAKAAREFAADVARQTGSKELQANVAQLDRLVRASYLLLALSPLGIAGGMLTLQGRTKLGGALMLAAVPVPVFLASITLVPLYFLVVGGVLALLIPTWPPRGGPSTAVMALITTGGWVAVLIGWVVLAVLLPKPTPQPVPASPAPNPGPVTSPMPVPNPQPSTNPPPASTSEAQPTATPPASQPAAEAPGTNRTNPPPSGPSSGKNTKPRATLEGRDSIQSVAFSPDGQTLAGGTENLVVLWDVAAAREKATLKGHTGLVRSVAFSPDGRTLASGGDDRTVKLWDQGTDQEKGTLTGHTAAVLSVAFSPYGNTLASTDVGGTLKLWDVAGRKEMATLNGSSGSSVAFSPDGKVLASGSSDLTIKLWDVATGQEKGTLGKYTSSVNSLSFSPDGQTLASGGGNLLNGSAELKLWDVVHGKEKATLKGHTNLVTSVTFSPDGQILASGSYDMTVKLWDVTTGQERATLKGDHGLVMCVAFSPDGKTLACGSGGQGIDLWDVPGAAGRPGASAAPAPGPATGGSPTPASTPFNPSREEVVQMLTGKTWYWHWEQPNRDSPQHYNPDGTLTMAGGARGRWSLERKWVVRQADHYLLPIDDHTLRGFHIPTGRQVGAFAEGGTAGRAPFNPGRDQLARMLTSKTWYWHWEQPNRDHPQHFNPDGTLSTTWGAGGRWSLEQRWVVRQADHYLLPIDGHTLRGFHIPTGRQVGAFAEGGTTEKAPDLQPPSAPAEAATPIRAEDLTKEYLTDRNAADRKFKGKLLVVDGIVFMNNISHPLFNVELKGAMKGEAETMLIECSLRRDLEGKIKSDAVQDDQRARLRGRCAGLDQLERLVLTDCEILAP